MDHYHWVLGHRPLYNNIVYWEERTDVCSLNKLFVGKESEVEESWAHRKRQDWETIAWVLKRSSRSTLQQEEWQLNIYQDLRHRKDCICFPSTASLCILAASDRGIPKFWASNTRIRKTERKGWAYFAALFGEPKNRRDTDVNELFG